VQKERLVHPSKVAVAALEERFNDLFLERSVEYFLAVLLHYGTRTGRRNKR